VGVKGLNVKRSASSYERLVYVFNTHNAAAAAAAAAIATAFTGYFRAICISLIQCTVSYMTPSRPSLGYTTCECVM